MPAAATDLEIAALPQRKGLELACKQAVVKRGSSRIKPAQEINPAANLLPLFVTFFLRYRSRLLHPALLRPLAASLLTLATLIGPTLLPNLGLGLGLGLAALGPAGAVAAASKPSLQGSQGKYAATIVVAASPQKAWQVLSNYGAMAGVMPDIKEAQILSRNGANLVLRQTYQAPYTFGLRVTATLAIRESPPRQLSYSLISSEQIRQLKGSWTITPVAGGVLVRHTIQVDPIAPNFLRPLYFELSEANLLQSMAILKRLIEQGD